MTFVTSQRKDGAAVFVYANPPLGTMTAAGAEELFRGVKTAVEDDAVRCIILTGGVPGIFVRHYDVDASRLARDLLEALPF